MKARYSNVPNYDPENNRLFYKRASTTKEPFYFCDRIYVLCGLWYYLYAFRSITQYDIKIDNTKWTVYKHPVLQSHLKDKHSTEYLGREITQEEFNQILFLDNL